MDAALTPGQTGCLEAGTYGSISDVARLTNSGNANGQITITSAPGQAAKIVGLVELEGSYSTLSGLQIDGSNNAYNAERAGTQCPFPVSNGLEIDGHNDIFQNNDFYQSVPSLRGNGIGVGWNGQADNTIIRYNRIHDLGQCQDYDQMIYLAHANGAQIYDNWMWNDPHGWGVQLYPDASNAHIHNNVIDGAGSGFVLAGGSQVSGNTIDYNIVMNSTGLITAGLSQGVGVSTCCGVGPNNSFTNNDVYNNPGGIASASGITLTQNTTANPNLVNPQAHDYRPTASTPSTYSVWDGSLGLATAPPATASAPPATTPTATTSSRRVTTPTSTTSAPPGTTPTTRAGSATTTTHTSSGDRTTTEHRHTSGGRARLGRRGSRSRSGHHSRHHSRHHGRHHSRHHHRHHGRHRRLRG